MLEHEAGQEADEDLGDLLRRRVGGHQAAGLIGPDKPGERAPDPPELASEGLVQGRGADRLAPDLEREPGEALVGVDPADGQEGRAQGLVEGRRVVGVEGALQGLTVLAVGATVMGLAVLFGRAGAALGALLMVLVGNPLSGVSSAPELLPEPAGTIGQLLPPGAGGTLLRSTAFFDGAAGGGPLVVLTAWVALGLVVAVVAALRRRRPTPATAPRPDPVAAL